MCLSRVGYIGNRVGVMWLTRVGSRVCDIGNRVGNRLGVIYNWEVAMWLTRLGGRLGIIRNRVACRTVVTKY